MNRELFEKIVILQNKNILDNVEGIKHNIEANFSESFTKVLYMKGEIIAREGEAGSRIYFIERGKVIISRNSLYGKECSGGYLMPGEFFGLSSCLGLPNEVTFKALTNCNVFAIDAESVKKVSAMSPGLSHYINCLLVNAIRVINMRQGNLTMGGCRTAFVNFIAEHFKYFGKLDDAGNVIVNLDLNLIDIAEILNMTRETLSRVVSEMKRDGIIDTKRRFIKIMDLGRFMA